MTDSHLVHCSPKFVHFLLFDDQVLFVIMKHFFECVFIRVYLIHFVLYLQSRKTCTCTTCHGIIQVQTTTPRCSIFLDNLIISSMAGILMQCGPYFSCVGVVLVVVVRWGTEVENLGSRDVGKEQTACDLLHA